MSTARRAPRVVPVEEVAPVSADVGKDSPLADLEWRKAAASLKTVKKTGELKHSTFNVQQVLRHHPSFRGRLKFNELRETVEVVAPMPWDAPEQEWKARQWTDVDDTRFIAWLEEHDFPALTASGTLAVVNSEAHHGSYHPVRDYLNSLQWDGVVRTPHWLTTVFGTAATEYSMAVGKCVLIAGVARAMKPGSKVDTTLVLEGGQGTGKTSAVKSLAPIEDWYSDSVRGFESREGIEQLGGVWIAEIGELAELVRSNTETVKAFLSRTHDKGRPAYGRRVVEHPRHCFFIGTTNDGEYLKDTTGNRRFWPVRVSRQADLEWLKANRDQLWAEAVHLYNSGEPWHLTRELEVVARQEQDERLAVDPWESAVVSEVRATAREYYSADHFLERLNIETVKLHPGQSRRVADILRRLGAEAMGRRQIPTGLRQRVYGPPDGVWILPGGVRFKATNPGS